MILSMTGFGRSEGIFEGKKITIDVKSLNSKGLDINLKMPSRFREKEYEIRKVLTQKIKRGKTECFINIESLDDANEVKINHHLVKSYIQELQSISPESPHFECLKMAMRMPDAISSKAEDLDEKEVSFLIGLVEEATDNLAQFRKDEGASLDKVVRSCVKNIGDLLNKVEPFEKERLENVKERYLKSLKEFDNIDENRYYQEIAFFAEKLDISEEKVRLTQHLKYYLEVMDDENSNGKKLGFISQEMGREINTLGSKANHSEIQKIVVMMKDELEKIKEQNLNIL
ncbi:MAG: YicC family protein [Flavobacteriales bacterium]|nr:MAG: YicC family protein [Flavobacteriales bacterium]